jgi:hypothetical protein
VIWAAKLPVPALSSQVVHAGCRLQSFKTLKKGMRRSQENVSLKAIRKRKVLAEDHFQQYVLMGGYCTPQTISFDVPNFLKRMHSFPYQILKKNSMKRTTLKNSRCPFQGRRELSWSPSLYFPIVCIFETGEKPSIMVINNSKE